jgi:DNA-binding transcriptional regulator GbsR (MarR family)
MNNKLELAQNKFIASIAKLCDSFGLNKFVAQLYAVLYLSDKPLSLDDMADRLGVSKGNVSINIRELEKWGAVKNVWIKGSRKDYYEANLDVKGVLTGKLRSGMQRRLGEISTMIEESRKIIQSSEVAVTEEDKRLAMIYQERFSKVEELRALASNAMALADKLL